MGVRVQVTHARTPGLKEGRLLARAPDALGSVWVLVQRAPIPHHAPALLTPRAPLTSIRVRGCLKAPDAFVHRVVVPSEEGAEQHRQLAERMSLGIAVPWMEPNCRDDEQRQAERLIVQPARGLQLADGEKGVVRDLLAAGQRLATGSLPNEPPSVEHGDRIVRQR